jgi:glycosyltransferase involved in cell wall biosynthesis
MNIKHKKITYIAEINLKSNSAYKLQVLKMCDAFSQNNFKVKLLIINTNKIKFSEIKKDHLLKSNFSIIGAYNSINNLNPITRIFFAMKIFFFLKNKGEIIFSRSVFTSILLSVLKIKNILEIHQPNSGFTNILFNFYRKKILKNTKFILINKNLNNFFLLKKNQFIVADDGVDLKDFKSKQKIKYKNSCVYTGSLFQGKGIDIILKLAKKLSHFSFYVYGDLLTAPTKILNSCLKLENIKLLGHVKYSKIPNILKSHKIIIMPYSKKVFGNHKYANIGRYMSPLKLFDYLAAGRIILASENSSYKHILKDNINSILCDSSNLGKWLKVFKNLSQNKIDFKKLKKNSIKTAKIFSWHYRIDKIVRFIEK